MTATFPLYDAHNHLQDAWLVPHRARVFEDLRRLDLRAAVVNGTAENDWADVSELARAHAFIRASFGLHPWNVGNAGRDWRAVLLRQFDANPAAGVGEIGLDRWMLERARADDSRLAGLRRASLEEQTGAFTWQLACAAERNVAATIHCLDAWGALLQALQTTPRPARGFLLHAYGGSAEMVPAFAALGAYFSFNGTFLGARQAARRAVFATIPIERLLVETDAPAMPLPAERQAYSLPGLADGNPINHPANIEAAYRGLAEVRGMEVGELAVQLEKNFAALFGA